MKIILGLIFLLLGIICLFILNHTETYNTGMDNLASMGIITAFIIGGILLICTS